MSTRDELTRRLAVLTAPGSFAARRTVAPADLALEVDGVGRIRFPITPATAGRLCHVARPARYGYKDETRLDRKVRDTWEIPRARIRIDEAKWRRALDPELERIRRDLGLADGSRIQARLYNMLVYGPGQFFALHQDSEKNDAMFGSLVVCLPSTFTGGELIVEHHGERMTVAGTRGRIGLVAFYADCHHEVRPVRKGHRVVLTYTLGLAGKAASAAPAAGATDALCRAVREFFAKPPAPRWTGETRLPPDRLVYLLDYQYTRRNLSWDRLKGADALRAAALRSVAERLDCEIHLGQADVHETWDCEADYSGYRRARWEDEDEEDGYDFDDASGEDDEATPELISLVDSEIELRHLAAPDGRKAAVADIGEHEVCFTRPSAELQPFESTYEGYTGNAGNTAERWYHRAAVVLWPRERNFLIRAKGSPPWAVGEIDSALKANDAERARAMARQLLPIWPRAAHAHRSTALLGRCIGVAGRLAEPRIASALLAPFSISLLASHLPRFADLTARYGADWSRQVAQRWFSNDDPREEERLGWTSRHCVPLMHALVARAPDAGSDLPRWILGEQWRWWQGLSRNRRRHAAPRDLAAQLSALNPALLALVECTHIAGATALHREIIDLLAAEAGSGALDPLVDLLRLAADRHAGADRRSLGLGSLHEACTRELERKLDTTPRARSDWSMGTPLACKCNLCRTLGQFMRSADQRRLEWPLAKDKRAHIHQIVESHGLPMSHMTRRTGSPYTLVLEKTADLFTREAAERKRLRADLAWLRKVAGQF
ncbi:MAG: 2OG-Fe(II) oxygenase [Gammaproteobacteria bacterium]